MQDRTALQETGTQGYYFPKQDHYEDFLAFDWLISFCCYVALSLMNAKSKPEHLLNNETPFQISFFRSLEQLS